jgi:carbonic anhydrase/acetyltransferase-like protein (isoleucine patch superfamily)
MLIEHQEREPQIHETAYIAPTAVVCGNVSIGAQCHIMFGAAIIAEGGKVTLGDHCIVMENVVIRSSARHTVKIGNHVLIGPRAYLTGCTVADDVFLATGATIFNGARIGTRAEVRINGTVHLKTNVPPDATVPIGWVAVGDPAEMHPPSEHDEIWKVQDPLDFPGTVFGLTRPAPGETNMPELTRRYARALTKHKNDRILYGE